MKKFVFTLGRMLDYKEQLLDREKNALAQLNVRMHILEDRVEKLQEDGRRLADDFTRSASAGITVPQMRAYDFQLRSVRLQVRQLQRDKELLANAIEEQMQAVILASQEVSGLQKLKEKQYEEYAVGERKASDTVIEEYVQGRLIKSRGA